MYPSVPTMPRACAKATRIGNYDIHPGVRLYCSSYAAFRNPRFVDDPDEFKVDRFIDMEAKTSKAYELAQLIIPFGGGDRVCIGKRFALLEETVVICNLLARYEFATDPTHSVTSMAHITLSPRTGVKLHFKRRTTGPFASQ